MRAYSLVWLPISESKREWSLGTRPLRERGLGMRLGAAKVMAAGVNKDHLERFVLESRSAVYPHRNAEMCQILKWLKDQSKTVVYSTTSKEIEHTS